MINCGRCGRETISETVAGKNTVNCKACRGIHSIKNKRILKCEKMPERGFYKQEAINIIDNDNVQDERDEQPEDLTDDLEDEQPEQPEQEQGEQDKREQEQEETPKQEKTIRDLLTDIFNKFDELETANTQQIKKQIELTDTVFIILNKLVTNENRFNEFVLQSNLKNNETNTNGNFSDIINIVKQQDLKNKIVINKLDTLIKAVT